MSTKAEAQKHIRYPRQFEGVVVSDKMTKSIVVRISSRHPHPMYGKYIAKRTKVMAHDEKEQAKPGDVVLIREARPLSARKRFQFVKIVRKSDRPELLQEEGTTT